MSLQFPTIEVRNKKGDLVLTLKRKDKYETLYYLFEIHQENLDDEEGFYEAWEGIKSFSRMMEIPLYDAEEVTVKVNQAIGKLLAEGVSLEKPHDITITIRDEATGSTNRLVIGVSTPRSVKLRP